MATLRAYLADLDQDTRGRWRSCASIAGGSWDQMVTASNQPNPWCMILVIAEDHSDVDAMACVNALPDLPLETLVDSTIRDTVSALLLARGVDSNSLGWLDAAVEYRDVINGIPVAYLDWDSFDVDYYWPA